jgi:methylthioribose-1-phosphate isomerase
MLALYSLLDRQTFIFVAIPVGGFCLALAFYRPYGQPFFSLIGSMFSYFFKPRIYIWRKIAESIKIEHRQRTEVQRISPKTITPENLSIISKSLDITKK